MDAEAQGPVHGTASRGPLGEGFLACMSPRRQHPNVTLGLCRPVGQPAPS